MTKTIEGYCHQKYHISVYNTSNQVCHNCILIIHAFVQLYKGSCTICTIVLQLLHNLPINLNVLLSYTYF